MRVTVREATVTLELTAQDTRDWANRPGASWPGSALAGKTLFAMFDPNGLVDVTINAGEFCENCPGDEFNAITADFLAPHLRVGHPVYPVAVGQFRETSFRETENP